MKRRKMTLAAALAFVLALSCAGCGNQSSGENSVPSNGGQTAASTPAAGSTAAADPSASYPDKTITIIVGNAAGGGSDLTCRIMTKYLPKYLNNATIVVANDGAGSGESAFLSVANAAPDGYTLGFFHGGQIMRTLSMDTQYEMENYKYIAQQTYEPRALAVRADDDRFPDLAAFIAYAEANPGAILVSDSGYGSSEHFASASVMYYSGIDLTPVHTNGTAESKTNLLGGHVDAMMCGLSEVVGQVADGTVRLLGVTSETRNEYFPDVPTFSENDIPAVYDVLRGFYCNKDVPQEIVDKISDAMYQVSQDEDFIADMAAMTLPVTYKNSAEFTEYVMETKENYGALLESIEWQGQ